jgi:hypothetical protein
MIAAATMDLRPDFAREVEHWKVAAERLADPESVASAAAWQSLELYLGIALRQMLAGVVARLRVLASDVDTFVRTAPASISSDALQARVVELREAYLRAETTVDFYADVLATRSIPKIAALLRSCDHIATRSMAEALAPLGKETPAALSYMDRGLGASILKYNLRLFDGTATNPVATIKVTRHNLLRPSALIHEAGHQVAFAGLLETANWAPIGRVPCPRSAPTPSPTCTLDTPQRSRCMMCWTEPTPLSSASSPATRIRFHTCECF